MRMDKRFYLCLFNENTWNEFLAQKNNVYGTTKNKLNRASKIKNNDFLICYVTKHSKFVGIIQKISDVFYDESKIWEKGEFPVRFNVNIIHAVPVSQGLPIYKLKNELSLCKEIKNKTKWATFFINSFNEFSTHDGRLLMEEIRKIIEV